MSQRLRHDCAAVPPGQELPIHILREYIDYARKSIHPRLTKGAAKILQKLYLTLRAKASIGQSIPVTTRHLESLIRLSQARAKAELRDEVSDSDANDVVELLQESLLEAFTDENGALDLGRKGGMGLAKQVKSLVKVSDRHILYGGIYIFVHSKLMDILVAILFII